jgi:hypothetical protein
MRIFFSAWPSFVADTHLVLIDLTFRGLLLYATGFHFPQNAKSVARISMDHKQC